MQAVDEVSVSCRQEAVLSARRCLLQSRRITRTHAHTHARTHTRSHAHTRTHTHITAHKTTDTLIEDEELAGGEKQLASGDQVLHPAWSAHHNVHLHACLFACLCLFAYFCLFVCVCLFAFVFVCLCLFFYLCLFIFIFFRSFIFFACVCVRLFVFVCLFVKERAIKGGRERNTDSLVEHINLLLGTHSSHHQQVPEGSEEWCGRSGVGRVV